MTIGRTRRWKCAFPIPVLLLLGILFFLPPPEVTLAQSPADALGDRKDVEIYFSPNGGMAAAVAREILAARKSIDVAMYSISTTSRLVEEPEPPNTEGLSEEESAKAQKEYEAALEKYKAYRAAVERGEVTIFDALAEAAARGVAIRMILNKARTGVRNKQKSLDLERIGVDILYTGKTMHEKFAVIDKKILINGSANWSNSADTRYSENTMIFRKHPQLRRAFQAEFELLLGKCKDFRPEDFE
jgi:phosphatidylserine/phosphatidylglycerophosphate/cardiolipin synthase-like enzyme